MPLFDYLCRDCGQTSEILVGVQSESPDGSAKSLVPACSACGSKNLKKLLSAPSSMSGTAKQTMPGPGDTACCGSSPSQAGCAGPGSCCGKTF
jgi:putative FmdB family regulatory protein